jgi:signal peptidase I
MMTASSQPRPLLKLLTNVLFGLFLVGVLALAGAYIYFQNSGWHFYSIASGSMAPYLDEGDVVAVKEIEPWKIRAGDVIAFHQSNIPVPVVHRVVGVQSPPDVRSVFVDRAGNQLGESMKYAPRRYFTKGDANSTNDAGVVEQSELIGIQRRTIAEPFASILVVLNRDNLMRVGVILIGAFIVWQVIDILMEGIRSKKQPQQVVQNTQEGRLG